MMHNLSKTAKDIVRNIVVLGAVELILGIVLIIIFFNASFVLGHILGIIYGTLLAIARMIHLEKSINASIALGDQFVASRYYRSKYFVRIFASALALGVAFWLHPVINIASVAVGLINAPIAAHIYKFMNKNVSENEG